MNGRIVACEPVYERLIFFLFPDYSVETVLAKPEKFILKRDVTGPNDRNILENYDNFIILSTKLYDETWDREFFKNAALDFRRKHFKTRKRVLTELDSLEPEEFCDNLISFMFTDQFNIVPEEEIMDLFNSYGSVSFIQTFLDKSKTIPVPKLVSTMYTFLSKVMSDTSTIFYKKKYQAYGEKIKRNYLQSLDNFIVCEDDNFGLKYIQFFMSLVK